MSGFLLDTNVVSELIKPVAEPKVLAWIRQTEERLFYVSVLTLGEIRKGLSALPTNAKRVAIEAWLDGPLLTRFDKRVLPITESICARWGVLAGEAKRRGRQLPVIDSLLAATALEHNLILATRNVRDVEDCGARLFNPWSEAG